MVNYGLLLLGFVLLFSCQENKSSTDEKIEAREVISKQEKFTNSPESAKYASWIESFRNFRDAVYQEDLEKIKSFIDFPIHSENNELWLLAKMNEESEYPDLSVPFTEADFDKNYKSIFDTWFVKTILKIKSQVLFDSGSYSTKKINASPFNRYMMYARFDKQTHELSLSLYSEEDLVDEEHTIEFSINYQFKVTKENKLKFLRIQMAG